MKFTVLSGSSINIPLEHRENLSDILSPYNQILDGEYWHIPSGLVGYINIPGFTLEIAPHIKYMTILDYIRMQHNIELDSEESSFLGSDKRFSQEYTIRKIFDLFASELNKVLNLGFPRTYRSWRSRSNYLIGQVDYLSSYQNILTRTENPFLVTTEKLMYSFPEAIEIRDAYLRYKILTKKTIWGIEKIIPHINGARNRYYLHHVQFSSMSKCYELAYFINNSINGFQNNTGSSISLLINSNDIFEKYFVDLLKSSYPNEIIETQKEKSVAFLETAHQSTTWITIRPDILVQAAETIIIDTKNKDFFRPENIGNSDYHQMVSYLDAFDSKLALLIYPVVTNEEAQKYKIFYKPNGSYSIIKMPINVREINTVELKNKMDFFIYYT